jgi:hypothetical protein
MGVHKTKSLVALAFALMISGPATAATVWNETTDGDLSGNPLAPTPVTFAPGGNDVIGRVGGADQDFFTFTVPTHYALTSLTEVNIIFENPNDNAFFIALESGPQITVNTVSPTSAAGLLGWHHGVPGENGTDILPAMSTSGMGATGFTVPLGPGQYSVWLQDNFPIDYDFRFAISRIPEPGTVPLLLTALAALVGLRLHRHRA